MRKGHNKRKPAALKLLAGNPGKRQVPEEVSYPVSWPAMPEWLSDEGKKLWTRCCQSMESAGVVADIDGELLAGYCDAVDCAVKASVKARTDSSVNAERRASWTLARLLGALFGIGPAERANVKASHGKKSQEKDRFFG